MVPCTLSGGGGVLVAGGPAALKFRPEQSFSDCKTISGLNGWIQLEEKPLKAFSGTAAASHAVFKT